MRQQALMMDRDKVLESLKDRLHDYCEAAGVPMILAYSTEHDNHFVGFGAIDDLVDLFNAIGEILVDNHPDVVPNPKLLTP